MAYTNETKHIDRGGEISVDGAVGIHNHSDAEIYYSFSAFSQGVKGIRLEARETVEFPNCTIYVKSIGHSADIEIIKG